MTFDPTTLPASIDGLHLLLAVLALLFLFLCLFGRRRRESIPRPAPEPRESSAERGATTPPLKQPPPEAALQLLGLLQQEARLIDFLQEELGGFSDADIGAAARVVHGGGRRVLADYFNLAPVRNEPEESRVELPEGFNAAEIRLTGRVAGQAPFSGTLIHRGWRATEVKLPQLTPGHDPRILAPAEVEL